jgi:hypothetical protein
MMIISKDTLITGDSGRVGGMEGGREREIE